MKTRILSAILMLLLFIPLLVLGGKAFAIFMAILAVMGLYELLNIRESKKKFPFLMKVFAYILVLFFSLRNFTSIEFITTLDYRVMAFIIFIFLMPMVFINDTKRYNLNDALFMIGSTLFIGLSFNLIIITRNYDILYIVYLLLVTTLTDTFALFTGRLVGKTKLAKDISPNKTIEGTLGGLFMGTVIPVVFYHVAINPNLSLVTLSLITLVLSIVGQIGDLVFSSIKRYYGIKDFSKLIPGHGGILDRFDSIIFVILASVIFLGII